MAGNDQEKVVSAGLIRDADDDEDDADGSGEDGGAAANTGPEAGE